MINQVAIEVVVAAAAGGGGGAAAGRGAVAAVQRRTFCISSPDISGNLAAMFLKVKT